MLTQCFRKLSMRKVRNLPGPVAGRRGRGRGDSGRLVAWVQNQRPGARGHLSHVLHSAAAGSAAEDYRGGDRRRPRMGKALL